MSGNRWSARSKSRALWPCDAEVLFDRVIDGGDGESDRQRGRRRGEPGAHRGSGHADRAEIVSLAIGRMVLRLIAVGGSSGRGYRGQSALGPVKRVDVTKGHGKIDGERDKRKP